MKVGNHVNFIKFAGGDHYRLSSLAAIIDRKTQIQNDINTNADPKSAFIMPNAS